MSEQIELFQKQIQLAETLQKPLIIHCVKAYHLLLQLPSPKVPAILHGFNKGPKLAQQLLEKGYFLSFGKALLHPHSSAAQTLATLSGPFFLETDDAPDTIESIYHAAASLRKLSVDELKACIFANWKSVLKGSL
jgi:TatD DNase family protein